MKADRNNHFLRFVIVLVAISAMLLGWSSFHLDAAAEATSSLRSPTNLDLPGSYKLYLPLVMQPELDPANLEVTQAVQQPGNPVTLIAGRTTIVRYTLTDETAHTGVNAYLHGIRDGSPLPGSPLTAINNPRTLETIANRADLNDTFNFELPASWTNGTINLWGTASNGTTYEVYEGAVSATFEENDPLPITVVPIAYTCTSGGTGTTTPAGPFDYLVEAAYQRYPVASTDLQVHAPVSYSGPCYNGQPYPYYNFDPPPDYDLGDWLGMLLAIRGVWETEGRPNRYYYGLVEIYCGGSCVSGLGYVGGHKVAVGWNGWGSGHNGASGTHAHEVGHNHNLPHAPGCGAGSPDPYYPYASGLIGDAGSPNYGYDIIADALKTYPSYYDFMTYCSSEWISDYNYEKLYTWEQAQASMAAEFVDPPRDLMVVSGALRKDGSVEIRPAFQMEVPEVSSGHGPYTLEFLDGAGAPLATYPFEMSMAAVDRYGEGASGEVRDFYLTVPYTPGIDQIRVVKDGKVLGDLRAAPLTPGLELTAGQARIEQGMLHASWTGAAGASYLVRMSLDGGATWQIVGVNLGNPSISLPLPAALGADVRLEVLASDGIHTQRYQVGPVSTIR